MIKMLASLALLLAAGGAAAQAPPPERTIVNDGAALQRLRRNSGITLQWISFETAARGHVAATMRGGLLHLSGSQLERGGPGRLTLDGDVLSVDPRSFTFRAGSSSPARRTRAAIACATAPTNSA
jgi:hypothetical protein